jgi:hypothetical protein
VTARRTTSVRADIVKNHERTLTRLATAAARAKCRQVRAINAHQRARDDLHDADEVVSQTHDALAAAIDQAAEVLTVEEIAALWS